MMPLKGKPVMVMGLRRSGLSAVRLLLKEGAIVTGTDSDPSLRVDPASFGSTGVNFKIGRQDKEHISKAELVVVSPGIGSEHPLLIAARSRGIPVIGELELASSFLDSDRIFAITGTNGKSTTTTLLGEILKEAGKRTFVGGNLGIPVSEAVISSPPGGWEAIVLEVSSFQLETISSFHPGSAALLNITTDHGERYVSLDDYAKAKFRIFLNQTEKDRAFLNRDDPEIRTRSEGIRSRRVLFGLRSSPEDGISLENGVLYYREGHDRTRLCGIESSPLKGRHNLENIAAAAGMALLAGISPEGIQRSVNQFRGLAHRMEQVRILNGVTYINDSKATNVGAVLRSLESVDAPIVLIAGGKEKGGGFAELSSLVREKVKTLYLLGEARARIRTDLGGIAQIEEVETLEEAVTKAYLASRRGDTVLLSPACSSYDMFKDYADRGERFKKAVMGLA